MRDDSILRLNLLFSLAALPLLGCSRESDDADTEAGTTPVPDSTTGADPTTGPTGPGGVTSATASDPTTDPTADPTADPTGGSSDVCTRYTDHCSECGPSGGTDGGTYGSDSYGSYGSSYGGDTYGYGTYGGSYGYYAGASAVVQHRATLGGCSPSVCEDALAGADALGPECFEATEDYFACLSNAACEALSPCGPEADARDAACGGSSDDGPSCAGVYDACSGDGSCCDGLVCVAGECTVPCSPLDCSGSYGSEGLSCYFFCNSQEQCCGQCNDGEPAVCD